MEMVRDPAVEMLFFTGGCVGNEVLPLLDFEEISRNPKIIASFSDGTTLLNAVWAHTGLAAFHGQSPDTFEALTPYNRAQFLSHFVEGRPARHRQAAPWQVLRGGKARGILVGGYTENFALLLGGTFFPYEKAQSYLLFLEDHEKFRRPAHISSLLSHIEQSGFLGRVAGLVFGHYSREENPHLANRLRRLGADWQIPVVYTDDFGHGENNAVFPIGVQAALDAEGRTLEYLYP